MTTDYAKRFSMPSADEQAALVAIVVLDKMILKKRPFSAMPEGDDTHLEDLLGFMNRKGLLDTDTEQGLFVPTTLGQDYYRAAMKRYQEYLNIFDVFCAVDLSAGEFAFEHLLDFQSEVFSHYLQEERFTDLRVTVCEFKKINPVEIVFYSFLHEKRFREPKDRTQVLGESSWQYQCIYGGIFREIVELCNRSLHFEELGYEDELGKVRGEDVIRDIVEQGSRLARENHVRRMQLKAEERQRFEEERLRDLEPVSERREVFYEEYYAPYHDPYYRSPLWDLALIALIL